MAKVQDFVKFGDLLKCQQDDVYKYYPVVKKLFFEEQEIDFEAGISAHHKLKSEVVKFLNTLEIIFGKSPPKPNISQDVSIRQRISESSLASWRLVYRKKFRGYSYLTVIGMENANTQANADAIETFEQTVQKVNLFDEEINILRNQMLLELNSEQIWIEEVNNFKKNGILSEIKGEVLEQLDALVNEELPYLVGENQIEFYQKTEFREKLSKIITSVLKNFQEQIPFKEDEQSEAKICAEFEKEVDKKLENLAFKNLRNKYNAKRLITAEVDKSVAKYTNAISTKFIEEPFSDPYSIRIQHETLQDLHIPVPHFSVDDLRSRYIEHYFEETDRIFLEHVRKYSESNNVTLNQCYQDLHEASNRFVDQEITQIFQMSKIPNKYIEQIRKSFGDQVQKVLTEIKDSTIANPEIAANIALWGVKRECKTKPGSENDDLSTGSLLHVNIRLLSGKNL